MAQDLITRTIKRYYEELYLKAGEKQLYQLIFPIIDSATVENFLLDTFIQTSYGVTYRHADMQAKIREFVNGEGKLVKIPRAAAKTGISEELVAKVAVGLEATGGFTQNEARIIGMIMRDHIAGHFMTKNKQAIEVMDTGVFEAHGIDGDSLNIDYDRLAALDMTYDFTQEGAVFSEATEQIQEELIATSTPLSNMVMFCGQNWLGKYSEETALDNASQNNTVNQIITSPMTPKLLKGTKGVYVLGQFRTRKMLAPVWVISYSPGLPYKANKDDVGELFLPADKALMFSLDDERWNVQRGIRVKGSTIRSKTVTGDVVFDQYSTDDPITDFVRSQTRHAFVPANINHTASSDGTFA